MSWMEEVVHESENYKLVVRHRKIARVVDEELIVLVQAELIVRTETTECMLTEKEWRDEIDFLSKRFDDTIEEANKKAEEFVRDLKDWALIAAARFLRLKSHDFEIRF